VQNLSPADAAKRGVTAQSSAAAGDRFRRYGGAALAVAVAALVRSLLQPVLDYGLPFVTFFGAVFLTAWRLGLRPTLFAVALSAIVAGLLFFPPASSPQEALLTAVGLVLFIAIGVGVAAMGEGRLRAQRRAEAEAEQARLTRQAAEAAAVEAEVAGAEAEVAGVEARKAAAAAEDEGERAEQEMVRADKERARAERIEAQLRHAQQLEAIGQLAGGVAHDFNNVLAAISGYVALILRALPQGDPVRTDVLGIQEAADRAAALTQQLLAFGRKQVMHPTLVDLREVLDDTGRMLQRLIGEQIDLAIVPGPMLSPVLADRGQLSQVIVNLAVNARDAMPYGGRLTIEARDAPLTEEYADSHLAVAPGPYVLLAVSDTGHGMSSEIKGHVFEPFFTTKPRGKGTGLGLSTVFGIVKQFGGHIFVYSEPGHGTTFKVYLPRAEGTVVAAPARGSGPGLGGTETILVVEDDPSIREVIRRFLEMSAYTVLEAATPGQALELAESYDRPIDLLLTDVVLPEMTGRELAERLLVQWPALPVVYMSGYADDAIVHQGRLEPDTQFLQKPFAPDALLRRLREVLGPGGAGTGAVSA
jgi:two-component system cell cycle sensor histidine kinase/response regulator CckA